MMQVSQEINRAVLRGGLAGCALLIVTVATSYAQQITGTPGSPSATTTIDGKHLPPPPPQFGGVIKETPRIPSRSGRRASCRPRARPTSC